MAQVPSNAAQSVELAFLSAGEPATSHELSLDQNPLNAPMTGSRGDGEDGRGEKEKKKKKERRRKYLKK